MVFLVYRINLLEAIPIYKYDIISLCETSLNVSIRLPGVLLENYSNNTKHGRVGLLYSLAGKREYILQLHIETLPILSALQNLEDFIKDQKY